MTEQVNQGNKHGLGSPETSVTPDQAKLAAGLLREFIGDTIPDDTDVDGTAVGQDGYQDLLDALDRVAHQSA